MTGEPRSLSPALASVSLQVNRDNVLQARAALLAEAYALLRRVRELRPIAVVGECGGDPVSPRAAHAFNSRIFAIFDQCERYAQELVAGGEALGDNARQYGYTEEQIAASYGRPGG